MANKDNYVEKKTWAEAVEGKPKKKPAKPTTKPAAKKPKQATGNGGGAAQ